MTVAFAHKIVNEPGADESGSECMSSENEFGADSEDQFDLSSRKTPKFVVVCAKDVRTPMHALLIPEIERSSP